jgi:hypothetical protein
MSDTVMIEVPNTARMLACCAGIAADGHEPATTKPGTVAAEYLGMEEQASPVSIDDRIAGLWFDAHKPPPDEPVLVTIAGIPCATPGNLTTITGQKKTAKTAFWQPSPPLPFPNAATRLA